MHLIYLGRMRTPLLALVICFLHDRRRQLTHSITTTLELERPGRDRVTPDLLSSEHSASSSRYASMDSLPHRVVTVSLRARTTYVCPTMENNVYAFDATGSWRLRSGTRTSATRRLQGDRGTSWPSTSGRGSELRAPVIDESKYRLYVVAKIRISETDNFFRLFSIDIRDGAYQHRTLPPTLTGSLSIDSRSTTRNAQSALSTDTSTSIWLTSGCAIQQTVSAGAGYSADDYLKQDYAFPLPGVRAEGGHLQAETPGRRQAETCTS